MQVLVKYLSYLEMLCFILKFEATFAQEWSSWHKN